MYSVFFILYFSVYLSLTVFLVFVPLLCFEWKGIGLSASPFMLCNFITGLVFGAESFLSGQHCLASLQVSNQDLLLSY